MSTWTVWLGGARAVAAQWLLLLAAGVVATAPRLVDWMGSWKQALSAGAGATVFIGPVAAGAACLAYAHLRSSAMAEVIEQGSGDVRAWLRPLLALWALASSALLAVVLATTTLAATTGVPAYPGSWWVVLPALAVLAAQTSIGAAVGWASGRPWAAPMAVVLVFLLFLWTVTGPLPEFFTTGGGSDTLAGERFVPGPLLAQAVAALALAVVVLAASHRTVLLRTVPRRLVVGGAALVWLVSWSAVGDAEERVAVLDDPPLACSGSRPRVCVFEETTRPLADLAAKTERQAAALYEVGAPVPAVFAQSYDLPPPGEGRVVLRDEATRAAVDVDRATDTLVRPATCPADLADADPHRAFEARHLLGRWLQVRAGLLDVADTGAEDAGDDWLRRDLAAQAPWVRTTYRQLATCAFAAIRMPDAAG